MVFCGCTRTEPKVNTTTEVPSQVPSITFAYDATISGSTQFLSVTVIPEPTTTNTPEPTATNTPEPTNTPIPTATNTPVPTATNTPMPTATNTPEPTATNTPKPTATNTPKPTATNKLEPTATSTPVPTATNTPTPAVTATPEPTENPVPTPPVTITPTFTPMPTQDAETSHLPTPSEEDYNRPGTPITGDYEYAPGRYWTYHPTLTPTPTPHWKTHVQDQWSTDNLPEGFSSEEELVKYIIEFELQRDILPTLNRYRLIYESYTEEKKDWFCENWPVHHVYFTTHHVSQPDLKIIIVVGVGGDMYSSHVVNGHSGVTYLRMIYSYTDRNGKNTTMTQELNMCRTEDGERLTDEDMIGWYIYNMFGNYWED